MAKAAPDREDGAVTYGRPRLLTHDEIIAGALELGLESLTMKKLADHLGVGTATLYQYWSNRKELVQAAAVSSLSQIDWPEDTGQHWSTYCWQFTRCVADFLADSPSLVVSNHAREYGYEVQFALVERFLSVLAKRGFPAKEAMRVYNILGVAAFGSAVEQVRQADFKLHGEEGSETARSQLASLDDAQFPLLRQALDQFILSPEDKLRQAMRAALTSIAQERGESPDVIDFG